MRKTNSYRSTFKIAREFAIQDFAERLVRRSDRATPKCVKGKLSKSGKNCVPKDSYEGEDESSPSGEKDSTALEKKGLKDGREAANVLLGGSKPSDIYIFALTEIEAKPAAFIGGSASIIRTNSFGLSFFT